MRSSSLTIWKLRCCSLPCWRGAGSCFDSPTGMPPPPFGALAIPRPATPLPCRRPGLVARPFGDHGTYLVRKPLTATGKPSSGRSPFSCYTDWRSVNSFRPLPLMSEVTRILSALEQGDPHSAERLLPLVYAELRQLAAQKLAHHQPGQTLDATAP